MKRKLSILLSVVLAVVLVVMMAAVGCKGTTAETTAAETTAAGETTAAETTAVETTAAPENVTLTYWAQPGPTELEIAKEQVAAFTAANPNVTISISQMAYDTVYEQIAIALATGGVPDVANASIMWVASAMTGGYLLPIDDLINPDEYPAGALELSSFNGNLYLCPESGAGFALMVNRTLLKEAGVNDLVPDVNGTWSFDDFYKVSKAVTDLGNKKYGYAIVSANEQGDQAHYMMMLSMGGKLYNEDFTKCLMNDPGNVELMNFYLKMVDDKVVVPNAAGLLADDADLMFTNGLLAMTYGNGWQVDASLIAMKEGTQPEFEIDMTTFPCKEGIGGPFTHKAFSGPVLFDTKDEVRIKWAKEFLKYLQSDESLQLRVDALTPEGSNANLGQTVIKKTIAATIAEPSIGAKMNAVLTSYAGSVAAVAPDWSERRAAFFPELQKILLKEVTPQEGLDAVVTAIDAILAK